MPAADANPRFGYPDILGMFTGGLRLNVGVVQCAFAIYPRAVAVSQAFEALLLLQNACDQPVQIAVAVQLPRKDAAGNRISVLTPKDVIAVNLRPAETGLLHIPVIPHLPTQPGAGNPVGVRLDVRSPKTVNLVRLLQGGRPPAALSLSPMRLNILRDIGFSVVSPEAGLLTGTFDVMTGNVNGPSPDNIQPRYETLWSASELPNEHARYAALAAQALSFARIFSPATILDSMIAVTARRFQQVGLPLQPGESLMIAKALVYAMLDGPERNFQLIERRWFQRMVVTIADEALTGDLRKLVAALYPAIVHDAVRIGLAIVERVSGENLGSPREHISYADEVLSVINGQLGATLLYAYLPLAMVGVIFNAQIKGPRENLWTSLHQIDEARNNRLSVAESQDDIIFGLMDRFITSAEEFLVKNQVPRPR